MGLYVTIEHRAKKAETGEIVLMGTYDGDKPFTLRLASSLLEAAADPEYYLQQCAVRHCEDLARRDTHA